MSHINFTTYITESLDVGKQVDAAYFDFQKAFDKVRVYNDLLLKKLAYIGFSPLLVKKIANYLSDRSQFVQLAGFKSPFYYTRSGVSQGSTIAPTHFLIMINDLPKISTAKCLLFPDDLKLYLAVNNRSDSQSFQKDIDGVLK